MGFAPHLAQPWRDVVLPVAVYRVAVNAAPYTQMCFQWVAENQAPPTGVRWADIEVYASALTTKDKRLKNTNPATNDFWILEPKAVWPSYPGETKTGDTATLSVNAFGALLIVLNVTTELAKFTFLGRGQRYQ